MATEQFEVSTILPARPDQVFNAWLDGKQHSDFTGGRARINPVIGGEFTAWDDYIRGTTVELEPHRRIVQEWSTTEFPEGHPPSRLELVLAEVPEGTRLTLRHQEIPEGQGESYEQGWEEHYFSPMRQYFEALGDRMPEPQIEGTPGKGLRGDQAHADAAPIGEEWEDTQPSKRNVRAAAPKKKAAKKKPVVKAAAKGSKASKAAKKSAKAAKRPAKKVKAKGAKSAKKPAARKSAPKKKKGAAKKRR